MESELLLPLFDWAEASWLGQGVRQSPWLFPVIEAIHLLSEAVKAYYNRSFLVKMITLLIALVYTFAVRGRMVRDEALDTSLRTRLLGATSIALWFTVAAAGRWIGFS